MNQYGRYTIFLNYERLSKYGNVSVFDIDDWYGNVFVLDIDDCNPNPCHNTVLCTDLGNGYD